MERKPIILVEKTTPTAKMPERAHDTDSGADVFCENVVKIFENGGISGISRIVKEGEEWLMFPGDRFLIDTGEKACVGIPVGDGTYKAAPGYEIQVRPRSGMALKQGLTVENAPGTVDCNYRGMLGVILINDSCFVHTIKKHDKIAQIVVGKVELLKSVEVSALPPAYDRNKGGFGHTGSK